MYYKQFRTALSVLILSAIGLEPALAFRVTDVPGLGIGRWNAAPHFVDGVERSLDGGLRYSITGGSWEAFHEELTWQGTPPTVEEMQDAIEQAFAEWESIDPATGLGSDVRFVPDFETPVFQEPFVGDGFYLNRGAEIDLIISDFGHEDFGSEFAINADPDADHVALTSGVVNNPAVVASGVDILFNGQRTWDIDSVRDTLAFTIPFALGLAFADEADGDIISRFYDDNYDNTDSTTALATLTNSFADKIDPFDPDNSPALKLYDVCSGIGFDCAGDPGISTPGVDILAEITPEARTPGWKLQNDDFAARQFLYPFVRVPGDFNADKQISAEDIDLLTAEIGIDTPRHWFDLTNDGIVDDADRSHLVHELENTWFGDSNLDGEFNSSDLIVVFQAGQYEDDIAGNSTWAAGDWNGDGEFGTGDLVLAFKDGGFEIGPKPATNAAPEPTSLPLILMACFGIAVTRRRGQSTQQFSVSR
ncbi:PEP-CTERM sorting domain-containing protein [Planctomycetota bacterium]